MKIAILTAFRNMPDCYSLVGDVKDQIKTLKKYGHEVVFFAQEGCKGEGIDCEVRAIFPHFKTEKDVENIEIKKRLITILNDELKDFDIAITHDLLYLSGYYTYRKAIMESSTPVKWIHWAHSKIGMIFDGLKMPKSKYIYMNYKEMNDFASNIGITLDDVRVIFNDKDPRLFFKWHPITQAISEKYNLLDVDIMQTYPMCSTRMDSKGIDHVIKVFSKLKTLGNKVLLVIPNANARKKKVEVEGKIQFAYDCGLGRDEILFTSTFSEETESGVPRDVVRDLMQISNLFVFPSMSEVCPNVLLEASMSKQLVVINKDCFSLLDFGEEGKTCLGYNFGSLNIVGYKYRTDEGYLNLAKTINQQLESSKMNQQFLKIKRACNIDTIYKKQLEPLLYEQY